jgi:hypothetical protein
MWKLFNTAYPANFSKVAPYYPMLIEYPKMPVRNYLGLIQNDALHWGVTLTLMTGFARTPELVDIANVKNICGLELSTAGGSSVILSEADVQIAALSDRIVRAWSELARTAGAFQHLRVLRLSGQQGLSEAIFSYFRFFPSLRVVGVADCGELVTEAAKELAAMYGWEIKSKQRRRRRDGEAEGSGSLDTLFKCYQENMSRDDDGSMKPGTSLQPDLPVLDCQIGPGCGQRRQSGMTVFVRDRIDPGMVDPAVQKRRRTSPVPNHEADQQAKVRKPVLRNIPGKDLMGLLAELS